MRFLDSIYFETTTGSLKEENMFWQIKMTFLAKTSYTVACHWATWRTAAASDGWRFHSDNAGVSNKEHLVQFVPAFNRDVQNI